MSGLLGTKALQAHIIVGLVVCVLLLGLLWQQTQSFIVIIDAVGGLVMAMTVGRWIEQYQNEGQPREKAERAQDS